jgi:hypothetical protein
MLRRLLSQFVTLALLWSSSINLMAQSTGRLYDPEPPVDSAYVRVILTSDLGKMAISVDGKVRANTVTSPQSSDYMVISAGKHQIELQSSSKSIKKITLSLDIIQGRALTIVFTSDNATEPPWILEDKSGSNKLKAMLSIYQFASKTMPLDISTGDGKTKVFTNLTYGKSAALAVNPISTELLIQSNGVSTVLGNINISMTQGNSYSIILIPDKNKNVKPLVVQNKIERYTGN